jgi:hypothetical protein
MHLRGARQHALGHLVLGLAQRRALRRGRVGEVRVEAQGRRAARDGGEQAARGALGRGAEKRMAYPEVLLAKLVAGKVTFRARAALPGALPCRHRSGLSGHRGPLGAADQRGPSRVRDRRFDRRSTSTSAGWR